MRSSPSLIIVDRKLNTTDCWFIILVATPQKKNSVNVKLAKPVLHGRLAVAICRFRSSSLTKF